MSWCFTHNQLIIQLINSVHSLSLSLSKHTRTRSFALTLSLALFWSCTHTHSLNFFLNRRTLQTLGRKHFLNCPPPSYCLRPTWVYLSLSLTCNHCFCPFFFFSISLSLFHSVSHSNTHIRTHTHTLNHSLLLFPFSR